MVEPDAPAADETQASAPRRARRSLRPWQRSSVGSRCSDECSSFKPLAPMAPNGTPPLGLSAGASAETDLLLATCRTRGVLASRPALLFAEICPHGAARGAADRPGGVLGDVRLQDEREPITAARPSGVGSRCRLPIVAGVWREPQDGPREGEHEHL